MQTRWFLRIALLYLIIPFMIFCLGWLRLIFALPIMVFLVWTIWQFWIRQDHENGPISIRSLIPAIVISGIWVLLSGVGGYFFQNWDHHWRNAVLRDLIAFDWPVIYSFPERGPIKMLVYYVGYWLPAALAGKLFGWEFANFILFLWTWLGVLLVILQLKINLKTGLYKVLLLLIFFSGMDALGALFFANEYPTLFPPIQHLEIWSGSMQYSSFTTQLFWVFNQAVPAWLCIALIMNGLKRERSAFVWALCFFFAPLTSIGLIPYVLIDWFKQADIKSLFKTIRYDALFASIVVVLISFLYFSSNTAAQERGFQPIPLMDFISFYLLEGGILWLMLAPFRWRDPRWIVTGLLLIAIPFIQFGSGHDFVMRASIAPLFYLMVLCGEVVFQNKLSRRYQIAFAFILLIGALTPLYEINRSLYRTYQYYFILDESQRAKPAMQPATHLEQPGALEYEHPNALVADEIVTLKFMDDKLTGNFIANVRQSLYFQYLAPR